MYEDDNNETYSRNISETDSDSDSQESETESTMDTEDEEETDEEQEDSVYSDEDDAIINHVEWMDTLDPIQITNQKYYIGCYQYMQYNPSILLLVNKIHRNTFMKFDSISLSKYFFWYSGVALPKRPPIDILQLHITADDVYTVVVKTFWIKIIQRKWKRIFKQRQQYIYFRKRLSTIRDCELGRIISGSIPSIEGMLSPYSCE